MMPLRRIYESHCAECGQSNIGRIEGDRIWINGSCSCPQPPGPSDPPRTVLLRDVVWPGSNVRIADLERQLAEAKLQIIESDACTQWAGSIAARAESQVAQLREALLAINAKAASWKGKPTAQRVLDLGAIRQISAEALAGDGGQEKKEGTS